MIPTPSPPHLCCVCVVFVVYFLIGVEWEIAIERSMQARARVANTKRFLFMDSYILFIKTASYNSSSYTTEKRAIPIEKKKGEINKWRLH